jgi:hypothetical protein
MKITTWSAYLTRHAIRTFAVLTLLYVVLIFALPANTQVTQSYHLRGLDYHVLLFAINLPSLVVWFAAFYSYSKLYGYARSIPSAPEGKDFKRLADGCAWLAWSLPAPAIISLVLFAVANNHGGFNGAAVIITNYSNLLLPLVGFTLIGGAARSLVTRAKVRFAANSMRGLVLLFVMIGVLYCYLTFRHLSLGSLGATHNPYYLPVWLAVLSVIVPYLYAWFVGLLAAYEISGYSKNVRGLLYRQPLQLLVGGLITVVTSSVALEYIGVINPRVGHLVLDYKLLLTLAFRIAGGLGFTLIAIGANRLKKIEEV